MTRRIVRARILRYTVTAIESGAYLPNVAIAVRLARASGRLSQKSSERRNEDYNSACTGGGRISPAIIIEPRARGSVCLNGRLTWADSPECCAGFLSCDVYLETCQ